MGISPRKLPAYNEKSTELPKREGNANTLVARALNTTIIVAKFALRFLGITKNTRIARRETTHERFNKRLEPTICSTNIYFD